MNARNYRQCKKCILDTIDDPAINFDVNGVCDYCRAYDLQMQKLGSAKQRAAVLERKVNEIKKAGAKQKYDCILGVSGGVDSSYLAYWAKANGLRPLIVHFDNGWNSELAVQNIKKLCSKLDFEMQTYVINWEEFKELQLAYLRAGVVDIEVLTDHAIYATILKIAKKYRLKYTINGYNLATEAIMPKGWVFDKSDFANIKDINSQYGKSKIRTYPHVTFLQKFLYSFYLKIESIHVLNYLDYNKEEAKKILSDKLDWKDYGGKHYESLFTKFYQAYILPKKFKIDKRKAHLSNLICSGQISRNQALLEMEQPLYEEIELEEERQYVLKKLGIDALEFGKLMNEDPKKHTDFKTQENLWHFYFRIIRFFRPWKS